MRHFISTNPDSIDPVIQFCQASTAFDEYGDFHRVYQVTAQYCLLHYERLIQGLPKHHDYINAEHLMGYEFTLPWYCDTLCDLWNEYYDQFGHCLETIGEQGIIQKLVPYIEGDLLRGMVATLKPEPTSWQIPKHPIVSSPSLVI